MIDEPASFTGGQHPPRRFLRPRGYGIEVGRQHPPPIFLRRFDRATSTCTKIPALLMRIPDRAGGEAFSAASNIGCIALAIAGRRPQPPKRSRRRFYDLSPSPRRADRRAAPPARLGQFSASTSANRTRSPLDAPVTSATLPVRSKICAAVIESSFAKPSRPRAGSPTSAGSWIGTQIREALCQSLHQSCPFRTSRQG